MPIQGRSSGVLAAGVIQDSNLAGSLAGQGIPDVLALIEKGEANVNVHTTQFPSGEVRGQIQ